MANGKPGAPAGNMRRRDPLTGEERHVHLERCQVEGCVGPIYTGWFNGVVITESQLCLIHTRALADVG